MKMTVQVPAMTAIDVEFPIYSKQDINTCPFPSKTFTQIELVGSGMKETTVTVDHYGKAKIEINHHYRFAHGNIDCSLGQGEYISSEAEFLEAVQKVRDTIRLDEEVDSILEQLSIG